jgi:hypothetical protein
MSKNSLYLPIFYLSAVSFFYVATAFSSHVYHQQSQQISTRKPMISSMGNMSHEMQHENNTYTQHVMHGMYGSYPMNREASGTSWVPDSSPPEGWHGEYRDWMFMLGGFSYLVFDNQRGKRGDKKVFDSNMFMCMGQRDFEQYTIGFRSMFSFEPITIGKCGYPLMFQTGETCNGITPLIDRQHPHDLFMELALVNTVRFNKDNSAFLYLALPGEPALGPPIFMMRFSSEYIPQAPLGHHWMDSTHITFGVITAGFIHKGLKVEASVFNGREPDQNRFDIERPHLDSCSLRLSLNPTENVALQASYGFLKSPEQLHPEEEINRYTLSAIYNRPIGDESNFQGAAIIGINDEKPGNLLPAFLLEGTLELKKKHLFFSRFEALKKDDLFLEPDPLAEQIFNVKKLTLGYVYEYLLTNHSKWGIGGLVDFPILQNLVAGRYGCATSYMLFLQIKII